MSDVIRERVHLFISDNASEVTVLGRNYKKRAIPFMPELDKIKVYLLSCEDLIITKLVSYRRKDINALCRCGILTEENAAKARRIIMEEYSPEVQSLLLKRLQDVKKSVWD